MYFSRNEYHTNVELFLVYNNNTSRVVYFQYIYQYQQFTVGGQLKISISTRHWSSTSCSHWSSTSCSHWSSTYLYRYQRVKYCVLPVSLSTRKILSTSCIAFNVSLDVYFLYRYQRVTDSLLPVLLSTRH